MTPTVYFPTRSEFIDELASRMPRTGAPHDLDASLRESLAEAIADAGPDFGEDEVTMRDHLGVITYELADSLVPSYTSDRFRLAADWPDCWHDDGGMPPVDGASLVDVLGHYLYFAIERAVNEAAPFCFDDLAELLDVEENVLELVGSVGKSAGDTFFDAVIAARAVCDHVEFEATDVLWELIDSGVKFWDAFDVVTRAITPLTTTPAR